MPAVKATKTEEIKVRIDPLSKRALEQIAQSEGLDLSDIARRAFRDLISRLQGRILREDGNAEV